MSLMAAEARELRVEDGPVRYYVAGSGPPLVLVHGLGGAAVVWHRNLPVLAERYTVYAPELWDRNRFTRRQAFTTDVGVRFLTSFLDAIGHPAAHLVGSSLGGLIAGFVAVCHPERVRSLTLADTAGLGRRIGLSQRLLSLPLVGEVLFRPSRGGVRRMLRTLIRHWDGETDALVEELYDGRRRGVVNQMLGVLRAGVNVRGVKRSVQLVPHLPSLRVPVLVLWGRQDPLFPLADAERAVALLPNGRLHVVDDAAHWPYLERSDEFNRVLLEFLTGRDGAQSPG